MTPAGLLGGEPIATALARPANGFTLVRLALAVAVVVSHAFSVTGGRVDDEPLHGLTGYTLGEHAVNGFFALSGFLVTMSLERRGPRDYAIARALRILPGFVVATFAVALGLGLALTTVPALAYLRSPGLWSFVLGTLTSFKTNAALPGLFPDNPLRLPMGTVWTLKWEVICYVGLLAGGLLGLLRAPRLALALTLALGAALVAAELCGLAGAATPLRLVFLFTAGGTLYLWRERVRLSAALALALLGLAALLAATPAYRLGLFAAEAYGVLALALAPALARPRLDLDHDLSYGVYLYGWPAQQALRQLWPAASSTALLAPSLVLTLLVATASWLLVERPALRLKARTLGRRTLGTVEPAGP